MSLLMHWASAECCIIIHRLDWTWKWMLVNTQTEGQTQIWDSSQLPDGTGCRQDKPTNVLSKLATFGSDGLKSYFPLCWSSPEEGGGVAVFCRSRNRSGFYCLRPRMTAAESSARCSPPCRQRHADEYLALSVSGCLLQRHGLLSLFHH